MGNICLTEAPRPPVQRARWNAERCLPCFASPAPPTRHALPWKQGEQRARPTGFVPEAEVECARILVRDGPLHEPHSEETRVEAAAPLSVARYQRDVMKAASGHSYTPAYRFRYPICHGSHLSCPLLPMNMPFRNNTTKSSKYVSISTRFRGPMARLFSDSSHQNRIDHGHQSISHSWLE